MIHSPWHGSVILMVHHSVSLYYRLPYVKHQITSYYAILSKSTVLFLGFNLTEFVLSLDKEGVHYRLHRGMTIPDPNNETTGILQRKKVTGSTEYGDTDVRSVMFTSSPAMRETDNLLVNLHRMKGRVQGNRSESSVWDDISSDPLHQKQDLPEVRSIF